MLVQAIAIARAGQYLMTAGEQFFVVGIYIRENMIAERFVVANTGPDREVRHYFHRIHFFLTQIPGIYYPAQFRP